MMNPVRRRLVSYASIAAYFAAATYALWRFGAERPSGALHYAVIVLISTALVSTAFGMVMASLAAIALIFLPIEFDAAAEDILVYCSIIAVYWIADRNRNRLFEEKAAELYRFAEFGRLSTGIFHDLMSPLTAISLAIERLTETRCHPKGCDLEQIEGAVRASKKISSILCVARKQLGSGDAKRVFAIKGEIDEAARLLEYKERASGVEIRIDVHPGHETYGDSVGFFRAISNIISNAIDAYDGCPEHAKGRSVDVSARKKGTAIEITIEDKGCGIPRHLQSLIFDPFFTTKSKAIGIGMGLSLTKKIIEDDFNGTISVRSEPGKGSVFTVTIQCAEKLF